MATKTEHTCPQQKRGMMPLIIYDALQKENVSLVLQWLEDGGDVNAADMSNRTLVHIACEANYINLLNELLKHPEVHINQTGTSPGYNGKTPLALACSKGNSKCVEALLSYNSECQLDLNKYKVPLMEFLLMKARINEWRIFKIIIEKGIPLHERDINFLITEAIRLKNQEIVEILLQKIFNTNLKVFHHLTGLYNMDMMTSEGAIKLFKMAIDDNDFNHCLQVVRQSYDKKDWDTLETLLSLFCNDSLKINIGLIEAIVGKAAADMETVLTQQKLGDDTLNGALLIAAIGGTTEEIFERLFKQKEHYSPSVLNYTLILASANNRLEILPTLLRNVTFSYSTLVHANNYQKGNRSIQQTLIGRALKKVTMETIPLPKSTKEEDDYAKQVEKDAKQKNTSVLIE